MNLLGETAATAFTLLTATLPTVSLPAADSPTAQARPRPQVRQEISSPPQEATTTIETFETPPAATSTEDERVPTTEPEATSTPPVQTQPPVVITPIQEELIQPPAPRSEEARVQPSQDRTPAVSLPVESRETLDALAANALTPAAPTSPVSSLRLIIISLFSLFAFGLLFGTVMYLVKIEVQSRAV